VKSPRSRIVTAAAIAVALVVAGAPAYAAPLEDPADAAAAAVAAVAPESVSSVETSLDGGDIVASLSDGAEVAVAQDPSSGVSVTTAAGEAALEVPLPGAGNLDDAVVTEDGSVTYVGDATTASVNVAVADDAIRVSTIIDSSVQAESFSYDFGAGVTVEINEDGSAVAVVEDTLTDPTTGQATAVDRIVADINAPWAKDADGNDVPTHYVADGSTLTQVVSHRGAATAYPVVADPTFDQPNILQYRVRFNRAETATIASGGAGVLASIGCGPMLPVCILAGATIWWNASNAQNSSPKRCVQITATQPIVVPGLIWWVDTYTGGPCR
jgi:hypothetical protein